MTGPLLLNFALALLWMFLSTQRSVVTLVIGFAIGFILMTAFQRVLFCTEYVRRMKGFWFFVFSFLRAFMTASWQMTHVVFSHGGGELHPAFIEYDIEGLTPTELLLLTHSINLTPGTTSVRISKDEKTLLIHCIDARDQEAVRVDILTSLQRPILAFTR